MPGLSPIQPGFQAGELSSRMRARIDLDSFKFGLAFCENWMALPHGSLLMRAGGKDAGLVAGARRVVPFRVSGSSNDYALILGNGEMRVLNVSTGLFETLFSSLLVNSHFDTDLTGWTAVNGAAYYLETAYLPPGGGGGAYGLVRQDFVTTAGHTYTVRLKFKTTNTSAAGIYVALRPGGGGVEFLNHTFATEASWGSGSFTFVAAGASTRIEILNYTAAVAGCDAWVDDAVVTDNDGGTDSIAVPWTDDQLADIQWDGELVKNRVVVVHPNVQPQVISFSDAGVWKCYPATFISKPAEWGGTNWPSTIEVGFQGRMWLGGTPNEPHTVWYSKSGVAFDFTTGALADDASSFIVSTKGRLRWLKGHKALLAGSEVVEHSADGNGTVIAPGNVNVQDESAYGSASVQSEHLGDEVVHVGRGANSIHTLAYDGQVKRGWVTRAISFQAEHLVRSVQDVFFARRPYPIIFVRLSTGSVVACTYDRAEKVIAWWRLGLTDFVHAGEAVETVDGGSVVLIIDREDGEHVEILPLHEESVDYLDSWSEETVSVGGALSGLERFEGRAVKIKHTDADGTTVVDATVAGGAVAGLDDLAGETVVVGLPFRAKATTLPVEGGNPAGTAQGLSIHWSDITARLSNSARPLLNSERATLGKPFRPSFDKLEELITQDVRVKTLRVDEGGQIDIEQDAPFRTEVCGVFGYAEVSRT